MGSEGTIQSCFRFLDYGLDEEASTCGCCWSC